MFDENKKKSKVKIVNVYAKTKEEAMQKVKKFIKDNGIKVIAGGDMKTTNGEKILTPFGVSKGGKACPCGCDRDPARIVKTAKISADMAKRNKELFDKIDALKEAERKLKAEKEKWWAEVRLSLPDGYSFDGPLHFNEETSEIEYLKPDDKDFDINL